MYKNLDLKIMRKAVNEMVENEEYKKVAEEKAKWEKFEDKMGSGRTIAGAVTGCLAGVGLVAAPAILGDQEVLGCAISGMSLMMGSMVGPVVAIGIGASKIGKCNNKIDNMLFNSYRVNIETKDLISKGYAETDARAIAESKVNYYTQKESDEHYSNLIKAVKVYEVINDTKFDYKDFIGEEVQEEFEIKEIESVDYVVDNSTELGE